MKHNDEKGDEIMVSRRTFFAITTMMLVVCFLFLLPQFVKDRSNPYIENSFSNDDLNMTESSQWKQPDLRNTSDFMNVKSYAVLIGDKDNQIGHAVDSWATMNKMPLAIFDHIAEYEAFNAKKPDVILIDPAFCSFNHDLKTIKSWNEEGITLVFCTLPSIGELRQQYALREFLGIRTIEKSNVTLSAIHLFKGFLLGGERIYGVETEEDKAMMDLNLNAVWVTLRTGTETYIQGELPLDLLPEQNYRNEKLPALLWRRALNGTNIFVVNGDYISDTFGIGFLSAIMAEDRDYYIYPIVNAQIFTVANFPSMADENKKELAERYGKGQNAVVRDLLWPSMESVSEISGFPMSCFISPQFNYHDEFEPDEQLIPYYLKLMKERSSEAGLSLQHESDVSISDKLESDTEFLNREATNYRFCGAYATDTELQEYETTGDLSVTFNAISLKSESDEYLFRYANAQTLVQCTTHDLLAYTDYSDLKLLSQQTALGYTNILLDMHRITWPKSNEPGWEIYYEKAASVLNTYWRMFKGFDRLTISGSDLRVRNFLAMDFQQERTDNTIKVTIAANNGGCDFILRTHKEDVTGVIGGTFRELETDAWLIHADEAEISINVKRSQMFQN